jgi:HEAT repeat protein/WD40 repeat protein
MAVKNLPSLSGPIPVPALQDDPSFQGPVVPHATFVPTAGLFSQDGRLLLVWFVRESRGPKDGGSEFYRLWDIATGKELGESRGRGLPLYVAGRAFFPGSSKVLTAVNRRTSTADMTHVGVVDVRDNRDLGAFPLAARGEKPYAFAVSVDGRRALSGHEKGIIVYWDTVEGKALRTFGDNESQGSDGTIVSVLLSPDGKRGISATHGGRIAVWDLASGRQLVCFSRLEGHLLAISADGRFALSSGRVQYTDEMVPLTVWNLDTGKPVVTVAGHQGGVVAGAFSPDGKSVVSQGYKSLTAWDAATGQVCWSWQISPERPQTSAVAFSPDTKLLLLGNSDGSARIYELSTRKLLRVLVHPESGVEDDEIRNSVRQALILPDIKARLKAVDALGDPGTEILPVMKEAMRSGDPQVRCKAAEMLGDRSTTAALVLPELRNLLKDPDIHVRFHAARSLCNTSAAGSEGVPDALVAGLATEETKWRRMAIDLLSRSHFPREKAVPGYIKALNDPDAEVRARAIQYLSHTRYESTGSADAVIPALGKALKDSDMRVRREAARMLSAAGTRAAPAVRELKDAIKDPSLFIRIYAADALMNLGAESPATAIAIFQEGLRDASNLRSVSVGFLGKLGPKAEPAIPALIKLLQDPDYVADGGWTLGQIGAAAVPPLLEVLRNNKNPSIRSRAVLAFYRMGPKAKDAVPGLVALLRERGFNDRVLVAETIGNIGKAAHGAVPAFVEIIKDTRDDDTIRRTCISELPKLGSREDIISVLRAAQKEEALNWAAGETLRKMGVDVPSKQLQRGGQ